MEHGHGRGGGGRNQFRVACMREIECQAAEAWNPTRPMQMQPYVQAAWDFLTVSIPPNEPRPSVSVDADANFSLREEVAEMAEDVVGPSRASEKGKARSFSMADAMAKGSGGLGKAGEVLLGEDDDEEEEDEDGTTLASMTGSRGYGNGSEPGGSQQAPPMDTNRGGKKRRAPSDGGATNPRGGSRSGRARGDRGGGDRGHGGERRRELSTGGSSGRGRGAQSSTSGRGRHRDRRRKQRAGERAQRGRGS